MSLGTKVGIDPGDIVFDGNPAPPKKGAAPNFRPISVVAKRLDGLRGIGPTRGSSKGGSEGHFPVCPHTVPKRNFCRVYSAICGENYVVLLVSYFRN